jgi:hypothetical protein
LVIGWWVLAPLTVVGCGALVSRVGVGRIVARAATMETTASKVSSEEVSALRELGCGVPVETESTKEQVVLSLRVAGSEAVERCRKDGACGAPSVMCAYAAETVTCADVAAVHQRYAAPDQPYVVSVKDTYFGDPRCLELRSARGVLKRDIKRLHDEHVRRGVASRQ